MLWASSPDWGQVPSDGHFKGARRFWGTVIKAALLQTLNQPDTHEFEAPTASV